MVRSAVQSCDLAMCNEILLASLKDRLDVREQIEANLENLNVIVTTYGLAKRKEDNRFLRHLKPVVCFVNC
jgi:hypothetical protein